MLKKYKILMFMILLSLLGICGIVGVWLYDGYSSRREILVNEVERGLFNAIQTYYVAHQDSINANRSRSMARDGKLFAARIKSLYPNVEEEKIQNLWDSLGRERMRRYAQRREAQKENGEPTTLVPLFMLQSIDFNETTRQELNGLLAEALHKNTIHIPVEVTITTLDTAHVKTEAQEVKVLSDGTITTTPILVNSTSNEFIVAQFKQPILYLLGKMALQLFISLMLVLALIGAFLYLFWTINRQNKLAMLRKAFVNNMTHELKTPVATVMAAVESVQRYGARDDKSKMERYLDISHRELLHLSNMIEKVLQLDMDEVKGLTLEKIKVDLVELIHSGVEMTQIGAQKEVNIKINCDLEHLYIIADAAHLKNVISNLLDNAVKYSLEKVNIQVGLKVEGKNVLLSIKDDGIGIDSSYLKDVFDVFFRVPSGNLHPVKGFGLGLAYVQQVVKQHGGQVTVDSILNKGTTFTLTIPNYNE